MFNLGDYVEFSSKLYPGTVIYGRIYQVNKFNNFGMSTAHMVLPEGGDSLPFLAYEHELTLIAPVTIGVELFRICPNHCASGCEVCFMRPGNGASMQVTLRTQALIVRDIKAIDADVYGFAAHCEGYNQPH